MDNIWDDLKLYYGDTVIFIHRICKLHQEAGIIPDPLVHPQESHLVIINGSQGFLKHSQNPSKGVEFFLIFVSNVKRNMD